MTQIAQQSAHEMTDTGSSQAGLTRNERLVLDVLNRNDGPMKAYALLEALKDKGVKAPMTVYRALDRLEAKGRVHKIDAINAFITCNHDHAHPIEVFLICPQCSRAEELKETKVLKLSWDDIAEVAEAHGFKPHSARLEIRGTFDGCSD